MSQNRKLQIPMEQEFEQGLIIMNNNNNNNNVNKTAK
jgi:hypothetical protein